MGGVASASVPGVVVDVISYCRVDEVFFFGRAKDLTISQYACTGVVVGHAVDQCWGLDEAMLSVLDGLLVDLASITAGRLNGLRSYRDGGIYLLTREYLFLEGLDSVCERLNQLSVPIHFHRKNV